MGRAHARGLREIYRSAGWPGQDMPEIELLTGGYCSAWPARWCALAKAMPVAGLNEDEQGMLGNAEATCI